ncbi:MAG TPA: hypothetical protein VK829_08735 [Terriglobales bacterium]|nr:hypothetical protein [Terriglobales bacterium]
MRSRIDDRVQIVKVYAALSSRVKRGIWVLVYGGDTDAARTWIPRFALG